MVSFICFIVSDNTSRASNIPLVTPSSLLLLARGRVALIQNHATAAGFGVPLHLSGYLAPEYRPNKYRTDIETEKVSTKAIVIHHQQVCANKKNFNFNV